MEVSGSIDYEVVISENEYKITFGQTTKTELAALMIVRELAKDSKSHLVEAVAQVKGKAKNLYSDRLNKLTTTEYTLGKMIEAVLQSMLAEEQFKESQKAPDELPIPH